MRDDPRKNLKWLEQELLAAEDRPGVAPKPGEVTYEEPEDLLERVDTLLEEEPEIPAFVGNRKKTKAASAAAAAKAPPAFNESAAVAVKTKKQLRQEAKQRKAAKKKAGVNRDIRGLTLLAALELLGILAILGWWIQWII